MSRVLIIVKRERSLPWGICGGGRGGGAGVRNSRVRKRYERYWAERKGQEMAERKAKRPHLPVASLNYSIRQSLGKKNDKLFGQPTISREDWPETGAGVERKLENTRSFTTHHGCSSMKRIREITYLPPRLPVVGPQPCSQVLSPTRGTRLVGPFNCQ